MAMTRERPLCRAAILKYGYTPFAIDGLWDGLSIEAPGFRIADGREVSGLSDGLLRQFRKMIDDGHFPGVRLATTKKEREMIRQSYLCQVGRARDARRERVLLERELAKVRQA